MGYDALSMNAASLPKVKAVIRRVSLSWAQDLLRRVMSLDNHQVVKATVDLALKEIGMDQDRKSTRLNSSHVKISYAVFCLKKKKKQQPTAVTATWQR